MPIMRTEFLTFYLDGRGVKSLGRLRKLVPDAEEICDRVVAGEAIRTAIERRVAEGMKLLAGDRKYKTAWLKDNDEAIDESLEGNSARGLEGSKDEAFEAFMGGMADELSYSLEAEVVELLEEEIDGGGDDEEGEEDGEESDDDGADDKDDKPDKK